MGQMPNGVTVRYQLRRFRHVILPGALTFAVGVPRAPAQQPVEPGTGLAEALRTPTEASLRSHIRFLSNDLLEGRAVGSRGEQLAARYIASRFEALGLQHSEGMSSYLQPVELTGALTEATLTIGALQRTITLDASDDFVAWPERASLPITSDGEIIFAGYGVRAPELNRDDFGDTPLTGRILLVLAGDPRVNDSSGTFGQQATRYGTSRYKIDQAARTGARGVLIVHPDHGGGIPWEAVRLAQGTERFFFDRPAESNLEFAAMISERTARRVVAASERDFDLLVRRAALPGFRPIPIGGYGVMRIRGDTRRTQALNVLGRVQGRDPSASNEHVVVLAHYDHLGIGEPVCGDSIFNGAEDNASGVAALLAAAAGLGSSSVRPRRTILFLATTGAERGHLGARAFTGDPPVPLENIVAVVSVDRANVRGLTADVVGLGAEQSGLRKYLEQAAAAEALRVAPDPTPEFGWFFLGDHLPFAEAGIPVVALRPGPTYAGRPEGWGLQHESRYLAEQYHRPSDEIEDGWDSAGLLQEVRLLIRLGWLLAETDEFPHWTPDSGFGPAADQLRLRRMRRRGTH